MWGVWINPHIPGAVSGLAQDQLQWQGAPNTFSQLSDSCSLAIAPPTAKWRVSLNGTNDLPKIMNIASGLFNKIATQDFLKKYFSGRDRPSDPALRLLVFGARNDGLRCEVPI